MTNDIRKFYIRAALILLCAIRRPNGQEGFVPKNYVKEIEPAVIKNVTKKKVMKPEKVKLRKKRTERQRVPKTVRRSALCMCVVCVYVCVCVCMCHCLCVYICM